MQKSAQLQAVIDVINEWKTLRNKPFDHILSQYFRDRRFIGAKDRQYISWICYDLFRKKLILEWWAEWAMKKPCIEAEEAYAIKILTMYLTLICNQSPGEINALFSNQKYAPRSLKRTERQMIETIWNKPDYGKDPLYHNLMPDNIRLNTPTWLYNMIMTTYPEGAKLLMSLNQSAMIDLRINTLKTTKKYVLDTFKAVGIEIIPTPFSAWGLRLPKRINLNTLDMYKAGLLEVQDEGSQILCQIINPQPNMTVVDYCAGAGGKSLTLAMLMNNKGKLILCDIALWRLEQATKRLRKAGVFNVQHKIVLDTPEGNTALTTLKNKADVVLVDAPCSGTGTWRRNPDARFRLSQNELDQLIYKQAAILEDAAKLVKKGGVLVYATCSILPIENQNQIQAFLNLHPEFTIQPLDFDGITYSMLQLYPHIHQTDGFFVARLLKH